MIKIKKGDYVLATKYRDGDPRDRWCIGFYNGYLQNSMGRHELVDGNGEIFRCNGFRKVKKISHRRGEFILSKRTEIEASGKSLWWWLRQRLDS